MSSEAHFSDLSDDLLTRILSFLLRTNYTRLEAVIPIQCCVCQHGHINPWCRSGCISLDFLHASRASRALSSAALGALGREAEYFDVGAAHVWVYPEGSLFEIETLFKLQAPVLKKITFTSCRKRTEYVWFPLLIREGLFIPSGPLPVLEELDLTGFHLLASRSLGTTENKLVKDIGSLCRYVATQIKTLRIPPTMEFIRMMNAFQFDSLKLMDCAVDEMYIPDQNMIDLFSELAKCKLPALETFCFGKNITLPESFAPSFTELMSRILLLEVSCRCKISTISFRMFMSMLTSLRSLRWQSCCFKLVSELVKFCKNIKEIRFKPLLLRSIRSNEECSGEELKKEEFSARSVDRLTSSLQVIGTSLIALDARSSNWGLSTNHFEIIGRTCPNLQEMSVNGDKDSMAGLVLLCSKLSSTLRKLHFEYSSRSTKDMDRPAWDDFAHAVKMANQLSHVELDASQCEPRGGSLIDMLTCLESWLTSLGTNARYVHFFITTNDVAFLEDVLQAHSKALCALRKYSLCIRKFSFGVGEFKEDYTFNREYSRESQEQKVREYLALIEDVVKSLPDLVDCGFSGNLARELRWLLKGDYTFMLCSKYAT